ncbi:hypothetical protein [Wolbachia endosymbiont of Trichogramma kaykai]
MSNLLNKYNTFYFIASSLATFTLLESLALINVPNSLILALAVLSVLAFMILYKIIIDASKVEKKFAHKERELTQEKHNLYEKERKFGQKIEDERKSFLKEKKSLEEKLEEKIIYIIGMEIITGSNTIYNAVITDKLEKVTKEKDELTAQEKELLHKISYLCKQLQEKEADLTERKKLIIELKRKIDSDKYGELYKEIDKLRKEKRILYMQKEELHKRKEELCVKSDELQCKFKEIGQKNKNLFQELKRKFEELDKADGFIKNQSFESDRIRQDCNNEVKNLRNSLLEQYSQIKELQYLIDKIEESMRENETIKDYSKKIVLGETQKVKFILGQLMEFKPIKGSKTSEETSDSLQEDLGCASRSPTTTRLSCSMSIQGIASGTITEYRL